MVDTESLDAPSVAAESECYVNSMFQEVCDAVRLAGHRAWQGECVLVSIVVSIPACHAGDRGSIPRRGDACSLTAKTSVQCIS